MFRRLATLLSLLWMGALIGTSCGGSEIGIDAAGIDLPDFGSFPPFDVAGGDGSDWAPPDVVGGDTPKPDTNPPQDVDVEDGDDVGPTCNPPFSEFLCPCDKGDDCLSGYCVPTIDGDRCAALCDEAEGVCEEPGWGCALVAGTCPDCVHICVFMHLELCSPCFSDEECVSPEFDMEGHCLDYGPEGSFCGSACEAATDCPTGYACEEVSLASGQTASFCRLSAGTCACSPAAIDEGRGTTCEISNGIGTCVGERYCLPEGLGQCNAPIPAHEKCNLIDDDCDGSTDNDYEGSACENSNDHGTCEGVEVCVEGQILCDGPIPAEETCNGVDDDCDGAADEIFTNTDGDDLADCVDPDDDNDGIPDDGDSSGTVGDTPCPTGQMVSCDDNCRLIGNHGQADMDGDGKGDPCDCDADGDLFGCGDSTDCDDLSTAIHPGVIEIQTHEDDCLYCNGRDDDCDGETDEGCADADQDGLVDCLSDDDDGDGVVDGLDNCPKTYNAEQSDIDADGLGDVCDDDRDGDGFPLASDCNDWLDTVFPGAYEECNGIDDNCNSLTDESWADVDLDGMADCVDPDDDDDGVLDDGDGSGVAGDTPCEGAEDTWCDDNCPVVPNEDQSDLDGDGAGDLCDLDLDGDGVPNGEDNCPGEANPSQQDIDEDGAGDPCDQDLDGDGHMNPQDNCAAIANPEQLDMDDDGVGDDCDDDTDGDGVLDDGDGDGTTDGAPCAPAEDEGCDDNCRVHENPGQADNELDGVGDACDDDDDNDGVLDEEDLCPLVPDVDQVDTDLDGAGDVCDDDDDDDGIGDDGDGSGIIGDAACTGGETEGCDDNCPRSQNPDQVDTDADLIGDVCDDDDDADGIEDGVDNCRTVPNPYQNDAEQDGQGDACDPDDDDDGVLDDGDGSGAQGDQACTAGQIEGCDDNCPLDANADQVDTDGDLLGDACDDDDDDDLIPDADDNCRVVVNPDQANTDDDLAGDACDDDDDHDQVLDDGDGDGQIGSTPCTGGQLEGCDDNCRVVPNADQRDTDGDLAGDACDDDDDGDLILDDGDGSGVIGDGVCDTGVTTACDDNCLTVVNPEQVDHDGDNRGDACDDDDDNDQILDDGGGDGVDGNEPCASGETAGCDDNCPFVFNPNQLDTDADEDGNACDPDDDDDGISDDGDGDGEEGNGACLGGAVADCDDNCPLVANPDQADADADGTGDACEQDDDDDGVPDDEDNCPRYPNPDQANSDQDDDGDACDDDDDDDGVLDDGDGSGLVSDARCVDGQTTACDDNCRQDANPGQQDHDSDLTGDACDDDDDNDEVPDTQDNCPFVQNPGQENHDADGLGDACDDDDDDDGVPDDGSGSGTIGDQPCASGATTACDDNCPFTVNADQLDQDGDGIGDVCENDTDGDGDPDLDDCAPADPAVHHLAPELCNGTDDDCDGATDEEGAADCTVYHMDDDQDGFGDDDDTRCICDSDILILTGYDALGGGDCDDTASSVNPDAAEVCDQTGRDEDCDGTTDLGCDDDQDGYCDAAMTAPGSLSLCAHGGGDCDDEDPAVHPGVEVETCDERDDDCDAKTDEGCDDDGDDFCDAALTTVRDPVTSAWPAVCPNGPHDCRDDLAAVNPFVLERCDGIDNDCNAQTPGGVDPPGVDCAMGNIACIDEGCDDDHDNYCDDGMTTEGFPPSCQKGGDDCDDDNPNVNPGAAEICDGQDNDCDDQADDGCDDDDDGYCDSAMTLSGTASTCAKGGGDCDDEDAAVHPGVAEACDGKDNDCDALKAGGGSASSPVDEGCDDDGDGFCDASMGFSGSPAACPSGGGDCDDTRAFVHPGDVEYCDGYNGNCDSKDDTSSGTADQICAGVYGSSNLHTVLTCTSSSSPDEYTPPYAGATQDDGWECRGPHCVAPWLNLNGLDQDGCECDPSDAYVSSHGGGADAPDSCAAAFDLGTLSDQDAWGAQIVVSGRIIDSSDEDWYVVVFDDSVGENSQGQNSFSAWIRLHGGANDAQHVQLDVFDTKGVASPATCPGTGGLPSCGANGGVLSVLDDWMWTVKGRVGNDGESPCNYDQGPQDIYSDAHSFCNKNKLGDAVVAYSRRVYIRVRLKSQATPASCDPYVFTVSNNRLDTNQGF